MSIKVLVRTLFVVAFSCCCTRSAPTKDAEIPLMPPEVQSCFDLLYECSKEKLPSEKKNHVCLELSNTKEYNLTPEDLNYFQSLLRDTVNEETRYRRQASRTRLGWRRRRRLRVRKEVRRMSRREWRNFVQAYQSLKQKGIYERLAAIHRGFVRIDKAHFGAAFLGWHRIYLLIMENALRREVAGVTIPYWDSSLDYYMVDPRKSIVWTEEFFGNGNGTVSTGPFAGRTGLGEDLIRNTGAAGTLITKEAINQVLSRQRHNEIMDENNRDYWLEGYHEGPHIWIDGHMSLLDNAPEDPVFWFHHSFIDYWWQLFMDQQMYRYGINPYNDYPDVQGDHNAENLMEPFNITNRAGYHQYWYSSLYTYQRSPTCSIRRQYCGSRYLRCNMTLERCVSVEGQIDTDYWDTNNNSLSVDSISDSSITQFFLQDAKPARFVSTEIEKPILRAGRRFSSPFTDPRTVGRHQIQQVPSIRNLNLISKFKNIKPLKSESFRGETRKHQAINTRRTDSDILTLAFGRSKRSLFGQKNLKVTTQKQMKNEICSVVNKWTKVFK